VNTTQITHEHPASEKAPLPIPDFLLMPLVEAAFAVVKKQEESEVPSTLRRISHFDSKALGHSTARAQIIQSLINNEEFAQQTGEEFFSRVEVNVAYSQWSHDKAHDIIADAATRNDLPLIASILWLKKPERYEFALGLVVAYSTVSMLENEQRDSQRATQTRVDHLQASLDKEKARAELLVADVSRLEGELREERQSRRHRDQKKEAQLSALQKQIDENDNVVARLKEARDRQMQRVEREASRAHELEARLKMAHEESAKKNEKITHLQGQLASALSSDIELTYEDLQKLIVAQSEAEEISKTLLAIMNKTRSILQKDPQASQVQGKIEPMTPKLTMAQTPTPTSPAPQVREEPTKEVASIKPTAPKKQRTKVSVPLGMSLESKEALVKVFAQDDLMVLIDGYNVSLNSFQQLPLEMQRERTISCATSIEARFHPTCVIVFDGQSSTTRGRVQSKVHVVFSPAGTSADDVIIERVKVTPHEKPILVVTSDKNLAARAKGLGCETISSEAFVRCSQ
jgi:hypothetical protein